MIELNGIVKRGGVQVKRKLQQKYKQSKDKSQSAPRSVWNVSVCERVQKRSDLIKATGSKCLSQGEEAT